jgi:hypothetical protein
MKSITGQSRIVGPALLLALAAFLPATRLRAAEATAWQPTKTRVFLVSLTRFAGARLHSFTTDDRLDDSFAELFRARGVPAEQIVLLKDEQANTQNIKQEFTRFLRESRSGELLIFYFGSHGSYDPERETYSFCAFNDNLSFTWALDAIESDFQGTHALLATDCCYSGGIVNLAKRRKTPIAYACLSSTFAHQTAWSGWRFMQCLMRGLAGSPVVDLNEDGTVDLDELAAYTARYMAFAAEGKPSFATTGDFDPKLRLASVKAPKPARVGELLEAWTGSNWAKAEILDARERKFKIHFTENTRTANDAWVAHDYVRPFTFARFAVGSPVEVQDSSDRRWHSAKVLETWESLHLCHNDDRSASYDEWFGPSRIRAGLEGEWSGLWKNDLGQSGPETLVLEADGESLTGLWSGDVKLKGERLGKDKFYFEGSTSNRFYRSVGRMKGSRLELDYCAHRTPSGGEYHGWADLVRQGEVTEAVRPARVDFSGDWTGSYENSREGTGEETLDITERAGKLQGVWSGVDVTGERLGNATFYLEGKLGTRFYRVVGRVLKDVLVLDYAATEGRERYVGWSTLKQ